MCLRGQPTTGSGQGELGAQLAEIRPDDLYLACACAQADDAALAAFDQAFGDAMETEQRLSRASAVDTSADAIEQRRKDVQARGKTQKS